MRGLASSRPFGRLLCFWWMVLLAVCCAQHGWAATPGRTLVSDTIYKADGTTAQGTLLISWPAFTTGSGQAVAAGQMSVQIGVGGKVSVSLIPNTGSTPSSTYKVFLKLDKGVTSEEYWTVPAAPSTTIAAIRSKVVPAAVAQQFVGRDYVDTKVAQISGAAHDGDAVHLSGDESIGGVKQFVSSPLVPSPLNASDAANKAYVDASAGVKADESNTFTQPQTVVDLITKNTPTLDVRAYGAKGDGVADDADALQTALNAAVVSKSTIYFPCGNYKTSKMLTIYAGVIPAIQGQNNRCVDITYTGSADVPNTLRIASDVNHSSYVSGGPITGITVSGNSHVTEGALGLYRISDMSVTNLYTGPANPDTGACMYVFSGVGNYYSAIGCTPGRGDWGSLVPQYGFVFDGVSSGDASTTSTFDVPAVAAVRGIGLWLKASTNTFNVTACQISGNGQAAKIDGAMHTFTSCLFEGSKSGKSVEITGDYVTLIQPYLAEASPTQFSITGHAVKVQGGYSSADVSVGSSAGGIVLDNFAFDVTKLTDSAADTAYIQPANSLDSARTWKNFATLKTSPPNNAYGNGTFDSSVRAQGSWAASATSSVAILPNVFATGKAWRAYFFGHVLSGAGVSGSLPRFFELTDTNNVLTTWSGHTITFSVDPTTGKFMMASDISWQGFSGEVIFVPLSGVASGAEQGVSAQFAGTVRSSGSVVTNGEFGTTLQAGTLSANNTVTLPISTDTLVGRATADTLTNKTLDTAGVGNVLKINGTQVSAVTGSGAVVLASSPTLSAVTVTGTATANGFTGSSANSVFQSAGSAYFRAGSSGTVYFGANGVNDHWHIDTSGNLKAGGLGTQVCLNGATSGSSCLVAPATGGGTVSLPTGSFTVSGAAAYSCGAGTTCSNTNTTSSVRLVYGTVTLSSGTASVTGIAPAYTSGSSFVCVGADRTSAAAVKIVNASASSITVSGTGTDVVAYQCVGN